MNLSRFTDFFLNNKKAIFLFIATFLVLSPDFAFAEDIFSVEKLYNFIVAIGQFFILLFTTLAWLLTMVISWFLSPEWLTWWFFGINWYLKEIWILVSNVVYFVFAFILIWIAFMNILGKWDKWELKQALPKFIVWVLIVPFSWFFVQFIVSITSILTVSVLTLPNETFSSYTQNLEKSNICSNYVLDLEQIWNAFKKDATKEAKDKAIKGIYECGDQKKLSVKDLLENNALWIMNVYTYWVMNLEAMDNISLDNLNSWIRTGANLFGKALFDIVFAVVYFILLITLAIALLVRWIWLWLYMMLSPVFWLLYFFDKNEWGGAFDHFNIKEFFALAMVPVYVAAALSFWLLFLSVVSTGMWDSSVSDSNSIVWFNFKWENATMSIWQEPSKVTLTIKWWWQKVTQDWAELVNWVFSSGKGMIWSLILQIFWIVILWMAVMAAFKSSKITNTVTEPIQQFGNSVWQLMAKAPTYAPIFGGMSAEWLRKIWTMPEQALQTRVSNKVSPFQDKFNNVFWANTIPIWETTKFRNMLKDDISSATELNELRDMYKWWVSQFWRNNPQVKELEKELLNKMKQADWKFGLHRFNIDLDNPEDLQNFMALLWENNASAATRLKMSLNPWSISKEELGWVKEWTAWWLSEEERDDAKSWTEIDTSIYMKVKSVKDSSNKEIWRDINIVMEDIWYKVNLSQNSISSIDSSNNTADLVKSKLTTDDITDLRKVITKMNWEQQLKFVKALFVWVKDNDEEAKKLLNILLWNKSDS